MPTPTAFHTRTTVKTELNSPPPPPPPSTGPPPPARGATMTPIKRKLFKQEALEGGSQTHQSACSRKAANADASSLNSSVEMALSAADSSKADLFPGTFAAKIGRGGPPPAQSAGTRPPDGEEEEGGGGGPSGLLPMSVKERRRVRQHQRRLRRKSKSKSLEPPGPPGRGSIRIPVSNPKSQISYQAAKQYLTDSLVTEELEQRHITLGWQHAGDIASAIRSLVALSIGQYLPRMQGVPIAIGNVRMLKPVYILEDHNCMHVDVEVQMVLFKVQPNETVAGEGHREIVCHAKAVLGANCAIGTAFGNLGMICTPAPPNVEADCFFRARFMGVSFKNGLCQVQCAPLAVKRFQ